MKGTDEIWAFQGECSRKGTTCVQCSPSIKFPGRDVSPSQSEGVCRVQGTIETPTHREGRHSSNYSQLQADFCTAFPSPKPSEEND
ncbi:hypothetical protein XELAEV_18038845mg [Xenopus laevis]|uniref:Uncharacterized protein n=1 Tax=Xenopus laevis TaxID=8355 RepID=A0A974H7C2_XENLA|nr:hypothetical protein XELAEV_18038845mg [Xenopus laevis]